MTGYFLDSSALSKHYHPEVGSPEVDRIFSEPDRLIVISRLAVVEIQSVFAGKLRSGAITDDDVGILRARFMRDIGCRTIEIVGMSDAHYEAAEKLIIQFGQAHRLRTLDALQLAVALDLEGQEVLGHFVAADKVLCEVADSIGLHVLNPEHPV